MFVMKKYMVLLLFLIGSSMPLYNQIDSIWIGKSYEPCNLGPLMNDTCRSSSGWIGPKTDTIAGINADPSCNPLCVFIVVYYEIFDTLNYNCYTPEQKAVLDTGESISVGLFISGLYWEGSGTDCYECDKTKLKDYFSLVYYSELEDRIPGIINNMTVDAKSYPNGDTLKTYNTSSTVSITTVGDCINNQGLKCNPETQYCCSVNANISSSTVDINSRSIDSLYDIIWNNQVFPQTCLPPCEPICEPISRSKNSALAGCDFPCNDGPWTSDSSEVINVDSLLNGCTGFSIKIYYSTRYSTSPPCPESYKDIRFDSIQYFGPDSCMLQIQLSAFVTYANIWLLTKSGMENLLPGDCKTEFRLVNAICVTDFDTLTKTGAGPCNPLHNDQLGCCWGLYTICRGSDNKLTYTKLDGTDFIGDTCVWFTRPCIAVCEEVIHSLAQNPNDLYGQNSFERFYSTMEGMKKGESYVVSSTYEAKSINTKIHSNNEAVIYDLMGNALGKRRALDYMYDYLDRGVYFILEKNKDEVLRIIKVYIEK